MAWTVGYVGGTKESEKEFEVEENALAEYYSRLETFEHAGNSYRCRDPPLSGKPWFAPTSDDALFIFQGIVRDVINRKGYSILVVSEVFGKGEPLQSYWHEGEPLLQPGDRIMFDHEVDPFPRKEGLYAIRIFQ